MDKNVVITGVSTGMGYQLCVDLISKNYFVFGSVRKLEDGKRLSEELAPIFFPYILILTIMRLLKRQL